MPHSLAPRIASVLTAIILTTALLGSAATPAAADGGSSFVSMVNGYRSHEGLGAVQLHSAIDRIAVERAEQISRDGGWNHDFDYIKRRFTELGVCWTGFGEIIAFNGTGSIDTFGEQWWNSPDHKAIMLSEQIDFTHAGGSRYAAGNGWYAAMIFVKLCGASATSPSPTFSDVATSQFRADIAWLVGEGITAGCSADRYCPKAVVTREQMASFIKRASGIPSTTADWFRDDDRSPHEADINRVAEARIAAGCADARYCPGAQVTRAQMASFLARALKLPAASRDWFSDDNGSAHEGAINRLAEAGVTGGCSTGRFCPDAVVTREQMAGFLHRAFGG